MNSNEKSTIPQRILELGGAFLSSLRHRASVYAITFPLLTIGEALIHGGWAWACVFISFRQFWTMWVSKGRSAVSKLQTQAYSVLKYKWVVWQPAIQSNFEPLVSSKPPNNCFLTIPLLFIRNTFLSHFYIQISTQL